jgi:hypothetical protein
MELPSHPGILSTASESVEGPPLSAGPAEPNPELSTAEDPRMPAMRPCRTRTCGRCARCQDDARWERIYREKFADPTYYDERPVRYSSPLA